MHEPHGFLRRAIPLPLLPMEQRDIQITGTQTFEISWGLCPCREPPFQLIWGWTINSCFVCKVKITFRLLKRYLLKSYHFLYTVKCPSGWGTKGAVSQRRNIVLKSWIWSPTFQLCVFNQLNERVGGKADQPWRQSSRGSTAELCILLHGNV